MAGGAGQVGATSIRKATTLCALRVSMVMLTAENAAVHTGSVLAVMSDFLEGHEGIKYFVKSLAGKLV